MLRLMHFAIAAILDSTQAGIAAALIAAWMVFMCVKAIAGDLDYAIRWHDLKVQAQTLRLKQMRRLRELGVKTKHPRR